LERNSTEAVDPETGRRIELKENKKNGY